MVDPNKQDYYLPKDHYCRKISCQKLKLEHFVDKKKIQSINEGRQCCGGRKLSLNKDLKSKELFVYKQDFRGWYCSVNWFFLFVQQLTGLVYTNKDCKVSTNSRVEPLGSLTEPRLILDTLKDQLANGMPIITCVKDNCRCGFCAPKAENREDFDQLIKRNVPESVFQ